MLASILASGLAVGAIYAMIGITYNTMFATSRVMSFTAGQLGMLGGVLGSLFLLRLGLHPLLALALILRRALFCRGGSCSSWPERADALGPKGPMWPVCQAF